MKCQFKKIKMLDGETVYDLRVFPNAPGSPSITAKPKCIFTCMSEDDAINFYVELQAVVRKYTIEELELIEPE